MPSCSASDAQNVNAMPPTAGGLMSPAAADGMTDANAPAPRGGGCPKEVCYMTTVGGPECPPHLCQHGKDGPLPWHFRPRCEVHDPELPTPPPTARQKLVMESLLPAVHGYVTALQKLDAAGELTGDDRGHLKALDAWREKLKAEIPPKK